MEHISRAFEWIAVAVLIVAFVLAAYVATAALLRGDGGVPAYHRAREVFGRGILVGLEILVAADLIRTVAVQPSSKTSAYSGSSSSLERCSALP